jgi:aspartate aminotransferase-like enzyme
MNIKKKIKIENNRKILFTAGPASLSSENLLDLKPCFGRGDKEYADVEKYVLSKISKISGSKNIARIQGSGSLGIEIMVLNFLYGKILIVDTGYYSDRIQMICNYAKSNFNIIKKIKIVNWKNLSEVSEKFDWIVACSTETSCGLKVPIKDLHTLKKKTKSKLMLDATASIGLEKNHELADVLSFSSCKGLFGLTGACFVCFNVNIFNDVKSFYLNLSNHIEKKMTGPYHTIYSLYSILKNYEDFKFTVAVNKKKFLKKMQNYLSLPLKNQPLLCTHVTKKIFVKNKNIILYQPRNNLKGSVLCHLGEAHLKRLSKGKIIDELKISNV